MKQIGRRYHPRIWWMLTALLLFSAQGPAAGETKVVQVPSRLTATKSRITAVLPKSYDSTHKRYPVLYLLHGYGGDHSTWSDIVPLEKLSDTFQLIFICPDGQACWYLDSPEDPRCRFETFFIKELLPYVDSAFRVSAHGGGRALLGFSMGGHGALTLLAKHPDLFIGACSIAGIMDLSEFPNEWGLTGILGPYERFKQRWHECSSISLAGRFKGRKKTIVLDCGTNDFALAGNRKEHDQLRKAGIEHAYYERKGSHDWKYVQATAPGHIRFFAGRFRSAD